MYESLRDEGFELGKESRETRNYKGSSQGAEPKRIKKRTLSKIKWFVN